MLSLIITLLIIAIIAAILGFRLGRTAEHGREADETRSMMQQPLRRASVNGHWD
jgi:hypothetical protein